MTTAKETRTDILSLILNSGPLRAPDIEDNVLGNVKQALAYLESKGKIEYSPDSGRWALPEVKADPEDMLRATLLAEYLRENKWQSVASLADILKVDAFKVKALQRHLHKAGYIELVGRQYRLKDITNNDCVRKEIKQWHE